MKVVLIDEAPGLGITGDVRDVKDGYARNYLIPKGLAVLATPHELARADARKRAEIDRRTKLNLEMESVGERLDGERMLFPVRVGPGGRLYGSITATEIAAAVNEAMGIEIDRRAIPLAQPIRELGHHRTTVRLAPDIIPTITITIYAEGTEPPSPDEEIAAEDAEAGGEGETLAEADTGLTVDTTPEETEPEETEEEEATTAAVETDGDADVSEEDDKQE